MKITRLELRAYGAFTGNSIALRPDAKVHVLIGPNEVGKSTRRAAIADLLYGIERRSQYAFKHDSSKLCIAASLSAQGKTYHLVRRKGDKRSLTDTLGNPVDPGLLPALLQGFDRAMFEKLCSISHEELKLGKEILLESQGAATEALFGAASGGVNMRALLKSFDEQIEGLYVKSSAGKRPLNLAIAEYKQHEEKRLRLTIDSDKWRTMNRAVEELDQMIMAAQEGMIIMSKSIRELETFREVREQLDIYQQHALLLADLLAEPLLSTAHFLELATLQQELDALVEQQYTLETHEFVDRERLETHREVDEALIAAEEQCRELVHLAVILNGLRERASQAQLKEQVPEFARRIRAEARLVWGDVSLDEICEKCRAFDHDLFRNARAQLAAYLLADEKVTHCKHEIEKTLCSIQELESSGGLENPEPRLSTLGAVVAEVERVGRIDLEIVKLQEKFTHSMETLRLKLASKNIVLENALDCRGLVLPARSIIERFEMDMSAHKRIKEVLEQNISELGAAIQAREQSMREIAAPGRLVTQEQIEAIRKQRDAAYIELIDQTEFRPSGAARGYERLVIEADYAADERFDQAARIGALLGHEHELHEQQEKYAALEGQYETLEAESRTLQNEWLEFSRPYLGLGQSPHDFYAYLDELQECKLIAENMARTESEIAALRMHESRITKDLQSCLQEAASDYSLGALLSMVRAQEIELRDACAEYKSAQRALAKLRRSLPELQAAFPVCVGVLQECASRLQAIFVVLSVAPETPLSKAGEIFERLSDLGTTVNTYVGYRRELTELEDTEKQFAQAAHELLRRCDPRKLLDFAERDTATILALSSALKDSYDRNAHRAQLGLEIERITQDQQRVSEQIATKTQSMDALLVEAGTKKNDLRALLERGKRYEELQLAQLEVSRHIRLAARDSPEQIVEKIDGMGGWTHIDLELTRLRAEHSVANERYQMLLQQKGVAVKEVDHARSSFEAVEAEAQLMRTGAEIDRLAREYAALTAARTLLADQASVYADKNQMPIFKGAAGYLKTMTLDRCQGIHSIEGDDGQPSLCVLTEHGEEKRIPEMSEGTQDQLYLALRLATIAQRLEQKPGPPLLLDDTLRAFDDDRACAGFEALGTFSDYAQVIYFTPRCAVAELATRALGSDAEILYLAMEEQPLSLL